MNALARDPGLVLADRWQRDFPLCRRPYRAAGAACDLTEAEAIDTFRRLTERSLLGRIGAVVRPGAAGASTLAALAAPPERLEAIARLVSTEPHVNHNYERDHAFNLWFVAATPTERDLAALLARIEAETGCPVLDLRLERPYHIDLGFGLGRDAAKTLNPHRPARAASPAERDVLAALEDGLPWAPEPFDAVGRGIGRTGGEVIAALSAMVEAGIVSRFGCVLRHRSLGLKANAMAVWDVPDAEVDAAGERLAGVAGVTLCYRRNRQLPDWPYNLFAMVHGTDPAEVRRTVAGAAAAAGLDGAPHAVLFSRRCFTQRGARYSPQPRRNVA